MQSNLGFPVAAAIVFMGGLGGPALGQPIPAGLSADPRLSALSLYEYFVGDDDESQCNARAYGEIVTGYDRWSPPIRIDADNRSGGCRFHFAIIDPNRRLARWRLSMTFTADGDGGQCGRQGTSNVQIVRSRRTIQNGRAVRIDTDDRNGGCRLSFHSSGAGPRLLVYFVPDDEGGQCGRANDVQVISPGGTASIRIDTDSRSGGCLLAFRLR